MKIYEVRDVTSDESYFTKGFFSSQEAAIAEISKADAWELAYEAEGCVILAVYEWTLDGWENDHHKVFEMTHSSEWDEATDEEKWSCQQTFPAQK